MSRRAIVAAGVLWMIFSGQVLTAETAWSDVGTDDTSISVSSQQIYGESSKAAVSSAPVYENCTDVSLALSTVISGIGDWLGKTPSIATSAPIAYRTCTRISDGTGVGWVTGLPGTPGTAEAPNVAVLVAQAQSSLVLELPDVATSPPRGGTQLVGVPVWFWVQNFNSTAVTAAIPGLAATLTAKPTTTSIKLGDGEKLVCDGPGKRYDPALSYKAQRSPCSHPYDAYGDLSDAVTVTWSLSWTATDGQAGVLPAASRTSTFALTIEEAQAVTD